MEGQGYSVNRNFIRRFAQPCDVAYAGAYRWSCADVTAFLFGDVFMLSFSRSRYLPLMSMPVMLLILAFCTLGLAGGASRADVLGQVVVRAVATALLILAALRRGSEWRQYLVITISLAVSCALPLFQLVPLPPAVWEAFPGREILVRGGTVAGLGSVWRPVSMVPGATINALFSLIVPVAIFSILVDRRPIPPQHVAVAVTALAITSAFVALFQFSGSAFDNPLINETSGVPSGLMANRNHQALLLAIGIVALPLAMLPERGLSWVRMALVATLAVWLLLMILATGSRAGIIFGAIASLAGGVIALSGRAGLSARSRFIVGGGIGMLVAGVVALSLIAANSERARSFDRLASMDVTDDLRARTLPVVLDIAQKYFPVGAGGGNFDPIFRLHEPMALLKPTYFNHAHNDFLEIIIDFGAVGVLVLIGAIVMWGRLSFRAWRQHGTAGLVARTGSAILLLTFLASLTDYPTRTPTIMSLVVIAAMWLTGPIRTVRSSDTV